MNSNVRDVATAGLHTLHLLRAVALNKHTSATTRGRRWASALRDAFNMHGVPPEGEVRR